MTGSKESPVVYAAGVLLMTRNQPRQFLLMRHPDRWDLPKGHAEAGETLVETALRETFEETGLKPEQIELDPKFRFTLNYPVTYPDKPDVEFDKHVTFFLGWVDTARPLICSEHPDYRWFAWQPPHTIQEQTVDPLLAAVEEHLQGPA